MQGKPQLVSRGAGNQGGVGDQWVVSRERKGLACTAGPEDRAQSPCPAPQVGPPRLSPSAPAPEAPSLPAPPVKRHRPESPRAPGGAYTRRRPRRAPAPHAVPCPSRRPPPSTPSQARRRDPTRWLLRGVRRAPRDCHGPPCFRPPLVHGGIIHFTDKEIGTERVSQLLKATQPGASELGPTPGCWQGPPQGSQPRPKSQGSASLLNGPGHREAGEGGWRGRAGEGGGLGAAARTRIGGVGTGDVFTVKAERTLLSPPPRDAKHLGSWPGPQPPCPLASQPTQARSSPSLLSSGLTVASREPQESGD